MAKQSKWLFECDFSQWSRLGYTERRLRDETGLTVIMVPHQWNNTVSLSVFQPHPDGDVLLVDKYFSRWSIDSATDWLAKLTNDYASWN